jgi:hypothetical protein
VLASTRDPTFYSPQNHLSGGENMDFAERVKDLGKRSRHAAKNAQTEEATKTSVVLPFIQTLGFDVFNLDEVIPEFTADIGLKKGEKVDFAIKIDGKVAILVEVKPITSALGSSQFNQLYRYFTVTEARLAILTNGKELWFFSDIDAPNKMDKKPFFTFDLQSNDPAQIEELARFQKGNFSIDAILEAASQIKYTVAAANYVKRQLTEPDDEFVKLIGRQIHDGMLTKSVVEQLRPAIQASLDAVIRDRIQDRLNVAFRPEGPQPDPQAPATAPVEEPVSDIVTTEDEVQAFMIIRAIAARITDIHRVTMRDAKSYCSVFVDDNNRKPVCRLYFNSKTTRYVGLFDAQKNEERMPISALEEIYGFADRITGAIGAYI